MTRASDLAKLLTGGRTLGGTGEVIVKDIDTADGSSPKITLQTGDTDIAADDVLGTIDFQAPDEGTGTDAILVAAGIEAVSEGDFSSSSNATSLTFKTGSSEAATEKMRIDSSGNVGIGESSPSADLTVTQSGSTFTTASQTVALFQRNSATGSGCKVTILSGNNTSGDLNFGDAEDEDIGKISYEHNNNAMTFTTNTSERMRIDSSGTVQIGGQTGKLTLGNNGTYHADIEWEYDNNELAYTINNVGNHTFNTNGSERMRLDSSGQLCIGSTTPASGASRASITQADNQDCLSIENTHASFTDRVTILNAHRAANSGYQFLLAYSGDFADLEFNLRGDGNAFADGSFSGGGADYAEYFEWKDGNTSDEDRVGISVKLDGNKIVVSSDSDNASDIIGVISANPSITGDSAWNKWNEKYLKDDYGRYKLDGNGERTLNPNYDKDKEYIAREDRKEWDVVGLMGKLRIKKGQKTGTNWIKMRDISSAVEEWLVR